jgi:hypothetical protein
MQKRFPPNRPLGVGTPPFTRERIGYGVARDNTRATPPNPTTRPSRPYLTTPPGVGRLIRAHTDPNGPEPPPGPPDLPEGAPQPPCRARIRPAAAPIQRLRPPPYTAEDGAVPPGIPGPLRAAGVPNGPIGPTEPPAAPHRPPRRPGPRRSEQAFVHLFGHVLTTPPDPTTRPSGPYFTTSPGVGRLIRVHKDPHDPKPPPGPPDRPEGAPQPPADPARRSPDSAPPSPSLHHGGRGGPSANSGAATGCGGAQRSN